MGKICIRGIECVNGDNLQDISNFYRHSQMEDGHLNKCKDCCKKEQKQREEILKLDPIWVEKEKKRAREKFERLGYKDKYKPSPEKKKIIIDRYKAKYPEKIKARNAISHLVKEGIELHHWSYNEKDWKDFIELLVKQHYEIHTHIIYDPEFMYYRDSNNNLLDTKEKHLNYIIQFIKDLPF